jgi:hypothetical protein
MESAITSRAKLTLHPEKQLISQIAVIGIGL